MLWQNYVARPKLNMFKKYYARQVTCIKLRLLDFLLPSKKKRKKRQTNATKSKHNQEGGWSRER